MSILISGLQNRVKNSAAYAEELGLMLIANGEEMPYLLTPLGEKITAGISFPVDAPVIVDDGAGTLTNGKFVVYTIVYASENTFPLVAARILSNPSAHSATYEITGTGDRKLQIQFNGIDDPLVTHIYIYRTALSDTALLAETAADAGLMNYVGKVVNALGALTFSDNNLTVIGNEPIDLTNFSVPQFRFTVWDGSYFWGFANHPFRAVGTWETDGTFSLDNPDLDQFYGGRDDQYITFDGVLTGGINGKGVYLFRQTGDFTGKVVLEDGSDTTLPTTASGNIVIIGPSANLYRSAYRNPFSWGYLQNIAGIYVPSLWEYKVSGSLGTAIAILPEQQLLKLDMEFPALCLTFNLASSNTDAFSNTKRQVSKLHSVTSHFSQFSAISKGRQVLWGMDFKNLAIVECDGYTQIPVSAPISILLRKLSKNRSLHLMSHGIYDPITEINAIWLSTIDVDDGDVPAQFDLCVYQHAPTGFWGVFKDYGILCSAAVEDPVSSQRNTLVGTETGFLGKAFDPATYGNWLPIDSIFTGFIRSATLNSITRSEGQDDFNPEDAGLVGNFCIVTNTSGMNPQVMQIASATFDTLTFTTNFDTIPDTSADSGLIDGQWKFFVGLIELNVVKYFNAGEPSIDKAPRELWVTMSDAENPQVQFLPEHSEVPTVSKDLEQDAELDAWFIKTGFPTKKGKSFGLSIVERSYLPTKFFDLTLK